MVTRPLPEHEVLAYFGHHKCASTWIAQVVGKIATEIGLRPCAVVDELAPQATGPLTDYIARFDRTELRQHVTARGVDLVMCMNADQLQVESLRPVRAFHVVRDPRDIIVSAYFSHRNSHPTNNLPHLQDHREALREATLEQGLFLEMEFSATELAQLEEWDYSRSEILELKMEDVTRHPYDEFVRIFRHLRLLAETEPILAADQARVWMSRLLNRLASRSSFGRLRRRMLATGEIVLGNVYAQRFEVQAGGRERGNVDAASHYRKGVAGDWRTYFTPQHAEAFDARFGDLLVSLGYETGPEWTAKKWEMGAVSRLTPG